MQGSVRIAGGNQQLPLAIASSLPDGCIHLNHQLVAIKRESDDTIILSFTTPTGALDVACDHVILTLPFSTLRHVDYQQAGFDALKQTAITELGYGTISKLLLQFDTPYWYQEGPWLRVNNGFLSQIWIYRHSGMARLGKQARMAFSSTIRAGREG